MNDPQKGFDDDVYVDGIDAYFISVPVDTNPDGTQDVKCLRDVCMRIRLANQSAVIWIRSTITPSTFSDLDLAFRVNYLPEFLTERNAVDDFARMPMVFTSSDGKNGEIQLLERIFGTKSGIVATNIEAILAKYAHNVFGAAKVTFFNCIDDLCGRNGADYCTVRDIVVATGHVSKTYTEVPGPDGLPGYGGKCFPKDAKAILSEFSDSQLANFLVKMSDVNSKIRTDSRFLLLGGDGFLGKGLKEELGRRHVEFTSLDLPSFDLHDPNRVNDLAEEISKHTHVVLLAAKLGRVLFETSPESASEYNDDICHNVISALEIAAEKASSKDGRRVPRFGFYSTSEVYGNYDEITELSPLVIMPGGRGLYAWQKATAEAEFARLCRKGVVRTLDVFRPFNVSGRNQRRGVVCEMVVHGIEIGKVWYSGNTYRSFTTVGYASRAVVDRMLSDAEDGSVNVMNVSEGISETMEAVAGMVVDAIGNVSAVRKCRDGFIWDRRTERRDPDSDAKMRRIVAEVVEDYRKAERG